MRMFASGPEPEGEGNPVRARISGARGLRAAGMLALVLMLALPASAAPIVISPTDATWGGGCGMLTTGACGYEGFADPSTGDMRVDAQVRAPGKGSTPSVGDAEVFATLQARHSLADPVTAVLYTVRLRVDDADAYATGGITDQSEAYVHVTLSAIYAYCSVHCDTDTVTLAQWNESAALSGGREIALAVVAKNETGGVMPPTDVDLVVELSGRARFRWVDTGTAVASAEAVLLGITAEVIE